MDGPRNTVCIDGGIESAEVGFEYVAHPDRSLCPLNSYGSAIKFWLDASFARQFRFAERNLGFLAAFKKQRPTVSDFAAQNCLMQRIWDGQHTPKMFALGHRMLDATAAYVMRGAILSCGG